MKWGFHSKRSGARRPFLGTAEALTAVGPDHIPGEPPKYHPHLARNNNITTLGKKVITVLHRQIDKRKSGKYRGVSLVWSQWTCIGPTGHGDCTIFTGTVFAPPPSFLSGAVLLPTGLSAPASIVLPSRDDMVPVRDSSTSTAPSLPNYDASIDNDRAFRHVSGRSSPRES